MQKCTLPLIYNVFVLMIVIKPSKRQVPSVKRDSNDDSGDGGEEERKIMLG